MSTKPGGVPPKHYLVVTVDRLGEDRACYCGEDWPCPDLPLEPFVLPEVTGAGGVGGIHE